MRREMSNPRETDTSIRTAKIPAKLTEEQSVEREVGVSTFALTSRETMLDPDGVAIRSTHKDDGALLWEIAHEAGGVDLNSPYAYMMQARNFSETCMVAEVYGTPAGFVTAHRVQGKPQVLFVWQIVTLPEFRGMRIAQRMLEALVDQPSCSGVRTLEATVTNSNKASEALFSKFAKSRGAELEISSGFGASDFPDEKRQDAERLFSIKPIHHVD
jgi:L-2,4-diaminobutyric acid acetyltransferase